MDVAGPSMPNPASRKDRMIRSSAARKDPDTLGRNPSCLEAPAGVNFPCFLTHARLLEPSVSMCQFPQRIGLRRGDLRLEIAIGSRFTCAASRLSRCRDPSDAPFCRMPGWGLSLSGGGRAAKRTVVLHPRQLRILPDDTTLERRWHRSGSPMPSECSSHLDPGRACMRHGRRRS